MCWHTDNFWECLSGKEAFAHTCELSQESRKLPAPCPHQRAVPGDRPVFYLPLTVATPQDNALHQAVSRKHILVWSGHTTHTVNPAATPVAIEKSDLDPRETLPCYFNHPLLFTLAVTPRFNLQNLLCRSDRYPRRQGPTNRAVITGHPSASSSTC